MSHIRTVMYFPSESSNPSPSNNPNALIDTTPITLILALTLPPSSEIERPEETLQEGEELRVVYHHLTEDAQFDLREQTDDNAAATHVAHSDDDAFMVGDDTGGWWWWLRPPSSLGIPIHHTHSRQCTTHPHD